MTTNCNVASSIILNNAIRAFIQIIGPVGLSCWIMELTSSVQWNEETTHPQYFSQHVPFRRQRHCFPQADWQPQGLYCRQGWSFLSVILFRIEWYPADFHVYFKRRTLPRLRKNLDLVRNSETWTWTVEINK